MALSLQALRWHPYKDVRITSKTKRFQAENTKTDLYPCFVVREYSVCGQLISYRIDFVLSLYWSELPKY